MCLKKFLKYILESKIHLNAVSGEKNLIVKIDAVL